MRREKRVTDTEKGYTHERGNQRGFFWFGLFLWAHKHSQKNQQLQICLSFLRLSVLANQMSE